MAFIFSKPPFYTKFVRQPTANDPVSQYIWNNPKLQPFLTGGFVIGAIDGSHIYAWAPGARRAAFWNIKGYLSQNCLFCCSFDLLFTYALTGWEGLASDAQIYHNAIDKQDLKIPDGCWQMQVFLIASNCSYHIRVCATIWQNGDVHNCGNITLFN